jgi:hypothetical protein
MTTYYTQIPTLEMRVTASPLIVVGTVGKAVGKRVEYYDDEAFVRTTYEVDVQEILKGATERETIQVEVLGGESGNVVTPMRAPMREGASLVLALAPLPGDAPYVPYLGSAFPLDPDGRIALGPQAAETLSSQLARIEGDSITLDRLRALIETIAEVESAEARAAESEAAGRQPPVTEMPLGFDGGGEPSAPQAAEQG